MLMPALGEIYVQPIVKLVLALSITFLMGPILQHLVPPMPASAIALGIIIFAEIAVGIVISFVSKIILSAIHIAGTIISSQIGLTSAMLFDPVHSAQSSLIGIFLSMLSIALVFAMDIHLILLLSIHDSYITLPVASFMEHYDDITEVLMQVSSASWNVAFKLSSAFIITSIVVMFAAGILSRLMPQLQVFFLILPLQILVGIFFLTLSLSSIMLWFMDSYKEDLSTFFQDMEDVK